VDDYEPLPHTHCPFSTKPISTAPAPGRVKEMSAMDGGDAGGDAGAAEEPPEAEAYDRSNKALAPMPAPAPVKAEPVPPAEQEPTLVQVSAQLERFLWDRGCA